MPVQPVESLVLVRRVERVVALLRVAEAHPFRVVQRVVRGIVHKPSGNVC